MGVELQRRAIGRAAIATVAIAVVMVGAIGTSSTLPTLGAVTLQAAANQTMPSQSSTTSSLYCVETGFTGELYVRVIADTTNMPISGANVTATITDYCSSTSQDALGLTNSTGYSTGLSWAGDFIVSVTYAGTNYTFPAQTGQAVIVATLSVPSGTVVERVTRINGFTTTAQPSIEVATPSAFTSNSSLGLRLVLQLSATGPSDGNLMIGLSAVNLLNSTRTVPYADDWAYPQGGLTENDYCAFPASLAFGVFSGNLSLSDYKTGNPLPLYNTNVQRSCTITLVPTSFTPFGNQSVGQTITGYWTGGINTSTPGVFMTFPPGVYTVIGADEWGQLLLLHFAVPGATTTTSGSGGTTSTTSTTTSSPTTALTNSTTSTTAATSLPTTSPSTSSSSQASSSSISLAYLILVVVVAEIILLLGLAAPRLDGRRLWAVTTAAT